MKIVFFGTPAYVLPILNSLNKTYGHGRDGIVAVVTQPPKPVGRKHELERSEADHWAFKKQIPIHFNFDKLPSAELGVCASYGKIIPENVISKFKYGILNIHPSRLPEFRGSSPVQANILTGLETTVTTVIKMDAMMDHGDIVSVQRQIILPNDTGESLRDRSFESAAQFLVELLPPYITQKIKPKPQEHEKATYTTSIAKQHAFIPPKYLSTALQGKETNEDFSVGFIKDYSISPNPAFWERFIRAMNPWPTAWTVVNIYGEEKKIKIHKAHVENEKLILDEVQLEGKGIVSWKQFLEGHKSLKF
ncbi:methionyl-tRNA formyltransferase [Candidatus Microgenomates bacterium]|nr:MAG: methionyl-tRNA formyltransferase [Candidatus Microgenomates bacterium]